MIILYLAAECLILVDAAQTVVALRAGMVEDNPLLGPRPSALSVCLWSAGAMLTLALVFGLAPRPVPQCAVMVVLFLETPNTIWNWYQIYKHNRRSA